MLPQMLAIRGLSEENALERSNCGCGHFGLFEFNLEVRTYMYVIVVSYSHGGWQACRLRNCPHPMPILVLTVFLGVSNDALCWEKKAKNKQETMPTKIFQIVNVG